MAHIRWDFQDTPANLDVHVFNGAGKREQQRSSF